MFILFFVGGGGGAGGGFLLLLLSFSFFLGFVLLFGLTPAAENKCTEQTYT